ncbi:MAG: hypothetical protein CMD92_00735 [Gammaproteobacteria bacterium]|nr:hypothetical protein [Gammaproteobacteria bacterium]HBW82569.1 hypothetical protein [Gammaproteobacteria bacterium]
MASVLNGATVRFKLSRDFGCPDAERIERIGRVAEVEKLMVHVDLFSSLGPSCCSG